jgi:hypothetical protein
MAHGSARGKQVFIEHNDTKLRQSIWRCICRLCSVEINLIYPFRALWQHLRVKTADTDGCLEASLKLTAHSKVLPHPSSRGESVGYLFICLFVGSWVEANIRSTNKDIMLARVSTALVLLHALVSAAPHDADAKECAKSGLGKTIARCFKQHPEVCGGCGVGGASASLP